MSEQELLQALNDQQKEAVLHRGSPLLILAGAGSGKTRVITTKIAYLIEYCGVDPRSILAVTFTNKAAREMAERVSLFSSKGQNVMIRTFHSFGSWLLRRNAALAGISPNFTIYDDDDSLTLLHSVCPEYKRQDLKQYHRWISRAKDYALTPSDDLTRISSDPKLPDMYSRYWEKIRSIGNVDFGDLIMKPIDLLNSNSELRNRIHQRYRVILVDEYQDSNVAQYELLSELYSEGCDLCVVGDDDQSIYRFRGAEVKNILKFESQFSGTRIIRLEENYRSTGNILHAASELVSLNTGRLGKTLWTRKEDGMRPQLVLLDNHDDEAAFCADLVNDGNYAGTAILYRTNAQSLAFESAFIKKNIPYKIVGALRFYEREEIKDSLALLALLLNPRDEVAFRRIINKPRRGIGDSALQKIIENSINTGGDLLKAVKESLNNLSSRAERGASKFLKVFYAASEAIHEEPLSQVILRLVTDTDLLGHFKTQDKIDLTQRELNIQELINSAQKYPSGVEGLTAFLEDIELDRSITNQEEDNGAYVTLITMHNTKGLEFDRVIITGLEDDIFPGYRSKDDFDALEEERRIFYVSITRAKSELYMTSCSRRLIWGQWKDMTSSRFLKELPKDVIEIVDKKRTVEQADLEYPPGTGIYHDDYGVGQVIKAWHNGQNEIVIVMFQNGKSAQFLPAYSALEKVSLDY